MANASQELNSELESFRQQWLSDLRHRGDAPGGHAPGSTGRPSPSSSEGPSRQKAPPISASVAQRPVRPGDQDDDYLQGRSFDDHPAESGRTVARAEEAAAPKQLVSALDHFEEAMEREAQGNMGESLKHYRRAYKLDNGVDRRYREKHFPPGFHRPAQPPVAAKSSGPEPSKDQAHEQSGGEQSAQPQTVTELIDSFSAMAIEPVPPEVEGMPQPPCPMADLPDELLVHILQDVAIHDVADFARMSLVCRRFAYLVSAEQRIWRRVCVGPEFGFAAMHHRFALHVDWAPLDDGEVTYLADGTVVTARDIRLRRAAESAMLTRSLVPSAAYPTWRSLFRGRPRIRFNGCYISTVNYIRPGIASTNQATWGGSPIHIVTYYRYLRFFRDGAVISLLTTDEPGEVVHRLTREELQAHRDRASHHHHHHSHHHAAPGTSGPQAAAPSSVLPTPTMALAHKGRWRLSSGLDDDPDGLAAGVPGLGPDADADADQEPQSLRRLRRAEEAEEGNLYIETEGVGPKYTYRMDLALRSAGKGARNNKLVWRGFYSYNKLTDDWAEFGLKNDKPFFFSRVRSYGLGE